jgi:hypothetical protein
MQDQTLFDSVDILTKVLSRLDATQVTQNSTTLESIQSALWKLLDHSRPAIRKRAIASYAPLVPLLSDEAFGTLVQKKLLKELVKAKGAQSRDRLATLVSLFSVIGWAHFLLLLLHRFNTSFKQTKRRDPSWTTLERHSPSLIGARKTL